MGDLYIVYIYIIENFPTQTEKSVLDKCVGYEATSSSLSIFFGEFFQYLPGRGSSFVFFRMTITKDIFCGSGKKLKTLTLKNNSLKLTTNWWGIEKIMLKFLK